jgi:hypothetical protein
MMRKLIVTTAALTAIVAGGALFSGSASAFGVDFSFGGHRHCWYDDGWHGPGFYWCGYAHRHGRGWGGPEGWHGWHH